MKITLIDPAPAKGERVPERVFGCTYGRYPFPNVFLLYAAAVMENRGHSVSYLNGPALHLSSDEFETFFRNDTSDVYLFYSVNLSREIDRRTRDTIRRIRGSHPAIVSVGPAPSYFTDDFIDDERTYVLRGETENTLPELLDFLDDPSSVPAVSYMNNGTIHHNPPSAPIENLDSIPFPARHLLSDDFYFNPKFGHKKEKFTALLTSRGCPYNCIYCVPNSLSFARELEFKKTHTSKPPYRARSSQSVIEEFRFLAEQGYTAVSIIDDEFIIDKKRVYEICDGIADLNIKWGCLSRADSIDEQLAEAMAAAGCRYVDIGVESLEQSILDDIRKDLKVETVASCVEALKKAGVFVKLNILIGSSTLETVKTIRKTVGDSIRLKPDAIMFGICNPFPGTEFYTIAKEKNLFVKGDYYPVDVQKESTISLPSVRNFVLERELRKANARFFLSPGFIVKNIGRLRSLPEFYRALGALMKKLF